MQHVANNTVVHRWDRGAMRLMLIIAGAGAVALTSLGTYTAVTRIIDPTRYPVELLSNMPVPVTGDDVVSAHADSILIRASHLSGGALWLLAAGDLFGALTLGAVLASVSFVLWRVVRGEPFHRSLRATAIVAGSALTVGSLLAQGLGGLGRMFAAEQVSAALGGATQPGFTISPLPIVAGLGVLALAYIFAAGNRLQRDTEGLV